MMRSDFQIKKLTAADKPRWDDFVQRCPEATFFHRAAWAEVIESAFSHDTYFLYAERNGEIEAVLPLARIKSKLFGHSLISLPFCVYGGAAATSEAAAMAVEAEAVKLADTLGVDQLELRQRHPRHTDWPVKADMYVTFRKEIDPDPEKNMLAIPRKQRAVVRKGIEAGLQGQWDDGIDQFYDMYSRSVHALGTPVFSRRYFQILRDQFGKDCSVLTIAKDGRPVSSVLNFYFRDEVLPYYGGGGDDARQYKANDFMYWDLMRRSCEQGIKVFDYGRSKVGTGSYSFKKNWGFEPAPLYHEYHLVRAKAMPDINPLNPKYRLFIETWKKMPLGLTRFLGPMLVRNLG
jgi:FemAB-related protein (PEP-CTERM system-associated)